MTFYEKLNLIMTVTNTTNSALANAVGVDASFVSRLRRGQRAPASEAVRRDDYPSRISFYLAQNCNGRYQQAAICEALKRGTKTLPNNHEEIANIFQNWLWEDKTDSQNTAAALLKHIAKGKMQSQYPTPRLVENDWENGAVGFGLQGKRDAFLALIKKILESNISQKVLINSDEDEAWLAESSEFEVNWRSSINALIQAGHKIRVIHKSNITLEDSLEIVRRWLPFYATGAVEPYYYPKTRDGVVKRTVIIAPDSGVLVSSSVGTTAENAANFVFTETNIIAAYIEEWNEYLSLCRPFADVFTRPSREAFFAQLAAFEQEPGDAIIKQNGLPTATLSSQNAWNALAPLPKDERDRISNAQHSRVENFENSLKKNKYTAIINISDIGNDKWINGSRLFCDSGLHLSREDLRAHIMNTVRLLRTYDNFTMALIPDSGLAGGTVFAKEDAGLIISKDALPATVMCFNQDFMTAPFMKLLRSDLEKIPKEHRRKSNIIKKLTKLAESIGETIS